MFRQRSSAVWAILSACLFISALSPLVAQVPTLPVAPAAPATPAAPAIQAPLADPYGAASAPSRAAIDSAAALMKEGKWKSAFGALDAIDPANADPYVLAMKIEICIQGYIQTSMHQAFSLVDLAPGQSLEELRAGASQYQLFEFDPMSASEAMKSAGLALPPILYSALGDYFYDVQTLFSGQWYAQDEEICAISLEYYNDAAAGGVSGLQSLMRRGELYLRFGQNADAEALIRQALALDPSNADAHMSLAVALAQSEKTTEAFAEIEVALASYKDSNERFNALLIASRLAAVADRPRSEAYIQRAEAEFPQEPGPGLVRHMIATQLGDGEGAARAADLALDRFSDSPYVVRSLITNWLQAEDVASASAFLDRSIARMPGKEACLGILYFYKALLVAQTEGESSFPVCLDLLAKSKEHFAKVYSPDNQVFQALGQLAQQLSPAPGRGARAGRAPDTLIGVLRFRLSP